MSNDINLAGVVTALNNKADTNLENSAKASEIERLANSTHQLAEATNQIVTVFKDTVEKDVDNLESNKFDKFGGTISGSISITKNLDVSGIATVPTPAVGTNDNQIATTAFVGTAVANLVGSAPETLNTLGELATAFQEHEEVADAINASIANKANDSDVVKLTGDQTISGTKTFTSTIKQSNAKPIVVHSNSGLTKGTAPNTAAYWDIEFTDKYGSGTTNRIGAIVTALTTTNNASTSIYAYKQENGVSTNTSIGIHYPASGNPYATAPTPASTTNDTKIATTAWVRDRINKIVDCSTDAATVAKEVTVDGFVLEAGARVLIRFTVTNTAASPTLNVSGTGAKAIYYRNAAITAGYLAANRIYEFVYDGAQYELIGDVNTDTNTKVTQTVTTTNAEYALLAMADAAATANKTNSTRFASAVTLNPSTGTITATKLKGTPLDAITGLSVSGKTITYTKGDGTTGTITTQDTNTTYTAASATPLVAGTAAVGTSAKYAREDHVHPAQTTVSGSSGSCTGNAATATKLAAAKTIAISGGATGTATSFDGSSNITIPVTALDMSKASTGTLAVARGGTGLTASPSMLVNLASTTAANVLAASPRPGVTGVLPVANGGTGSSTKNFVDLSNAQTISGVKTFSDTISLTYGSTSVDGTLNKQITGKMGNNDNWWIGVGAAGNDNGYVEIATNDNGNEPIYIRQYTGSENTLVRSLTLLDASGNTVLPGRIVFSNGAQLWVG